MTVVCDSLQPPLWAVRVFSDYNFLRVVESRLLLENALKSQAFQRVFEERDILEIVGRGLDLWLGSPEVSVGSGPGAGLVGGELWLERLLGERHLSRNKLVVGEVVDLWLVLFFG